MPNLSSATLKCLICKSTLILKGRYAQQIAESGICPICNRQGMLTMTTMKVAVGSKSNA